jgi:hypothetical protein
MLVMVLAFGLVAVSCTTTDFKSNVVGEYNLIPKIAGKDFEALGLITITSEEVTTISPLHFNTTHSGSKVTFDLLLQKAKELYPDTSDIINVRIDKYDISTTSLFDFFTGSTVTVRYTGNALAINYTTALDVTKNDTSESRTLPREESGILGAFGTLFGQ